MLKVSVILVVFITAAYCQSVLVKRNAPAPHREYTEIFLGDMLDELEPVIKTLCEEWDKYQSDAFVRRDAPSTPNVLDSLQKNMEQFKNCIDQTLAKTVDQVNAKQVQPVFEVLGEHLNKLTKAFEDLTATKATYQK